ncbi:MAG: cytochrome P450 [Anaerolineae bacterium]|nr:cytochrome P450 [Anaerolineae bacterium]
MNPINIASPQFKANPYPIYAQLRAESPVHRIMLPSKQPAWLVTRYDDVVAVLKDERLVKDRTNAMTSEQLGKQPWVPGFMKPLARNMLDLDAPDHTRLRALVHKAFTPRLIEHMRERIERLTNELMDTAERKGSIDLVRDYALPIPTTIIAEMLGIPAEDHHKFNRWSNMMVNTASAIDMVRLIPAMYRFIAYLRGCINQRRADPQDDLISALLQARENDDRLSEDELLGMVVLLLVAGHETTVNLIASGSLALLENPDQMAKLRGDPTLIKSALEELLRYTTPVQNATERYASQDITLQGVTIPRGELVFAVLASANRDENQFENPDVMDITRENNRHLAFSNGIHYCLGSPLARMEGQIAIQNLLRRMPNLHLATARDSLRWRGGLVVRALEKLPVAV